MTTPSWVIPGGTNKLLYDTGTALAEATVGSGLTLAGGTLTASGGGGAVGTLMTFATVGDVMSAAIPSNIKAIQVAGFGAPGDGGAGIYKRVSGTTPFRTEKGLVPLPTPPNFAAGIVPNLVYADTWYDTQGGQQGTYRPIVAGSLALLIVQNATLPSAANYADSAGNVYTLIAGSGFTGGTPAGSIAIYYCANPAYAPPGTTFNVPYSGGAGGQRPTIIVYSVPGFTGATFDQIARVESTSSSTGSSATTGALLGGPQLVLGVVGNTLTVANSLTPLVYTAPAGWIDAAPPTWGMNPISFFVAPGAGSVTYSPVWTAGAVPSSTITYVVTFRTLPVAVFTPTYWELQPTFPLHTAQYGISPAAADCFLPYMSFGAWAGYVSPASDTSVGRTYPVGSGAYDTTAGSCTISIANPAVIQIVTPRPTRDYSTPYEHRLRAGQMISFDTTGALPGHIVRGKRYFIQYASTTDNTSTNPALQNTLQITETNLFATYLVGQTAAKGTPVSTLGDTQSGTHSYTVYGETWLDVVWDPGIYFACFLGLPISWGVKRLRISAYGVRHQSAGSFYAPVVDYNSAAPCNPYTYQALFQTTSWPSLVPVKTITLVTPAQAANFYVNSWVVLKCNEVQSSQVGNWNNYTFEFAQVRSINTTTGVITFWDYLRYNYRSTFPSYVGFSGATSIVNGPAVVAQLPDTFDQELEIRGLSMYGLTEQAFAGLYSLKLIDCDVYGWSYKTGPFPSTIRKVVFENCIIHCAGAEIDKMVDYLAYIDCEFDQGGYLQVQSGGVNNMVIERCIMGEGGIAGTVKSVMIRDSVISGPFFYLGSVYGVVERLTIVNSSIQAFAFALQGQEQLYFLQTGLSFADGTLKIADGTTLRVSGQWNAPSHGVFSTCPIWWGQPGGKIMVCTDATNSNGITATGPKIGPIPMMATFTVLDCYVDGAGAFCVDTTLQALPTATVTVTGTIASSVLTITAISPSDAVLLTGMFVYGGGLPTVTPPSTGGPASPVTCSSVNVPNGSAPNGTNNLGTYTLSTTSGTIVDDATPKTYTVRAQMYFMPHPAPRVTMSGCTGGKLAASQMGAPADLPLYSYFSQGYHADVLSYYPEAFVALAGKLKSWTVNVVQPYTGSASTFNVQICMIGWKNVGGNIYATYQVQTINMKVAGVRTITADATTTVGPGGAGDTLVAVGFFLNGGHSVTLPGFSGGDTYVNMPLFHMVGLADQGINWGTMSVRNTTSGLDLVADTVLGTISQAD